MIGPQVGLPLQVSRVTGAAGAERVGARYPLPYPRQQAVHLCGGDYRAMRQGCARPQHHHGRGRHGQRRAPRFVDEHQAIIVLFQMAVFDVDPTDAIRKLRQGVQIDGHGTPSKDLTGFRNLSGLRRRRQREQAAAKAFAAANAGLDRVLRQWRIDHLQHSIKLHGEQF